MLTDLFLTKHARRLRGYGQRIQAVGALEPELRVASDAKLRQRAETCRQRVCAKEPLEGLQVEAFALVREAARRVLGLRLFDVQLIGAMALHDGVIAEMKTGEGKTLVAVPAVFLNALSGKGVHLVTVNDYLAERDAGWMGPVYRFLGLSVGVIQEDMGADESEDVDRRKAAYACDVTYGTNHEIAFDYLRDNLANELWQVVGRGYHYAIVDEVDFLLIDEARTPLIISGPAGEDHGVIRRIDKLVRKLQEGVHHSVDARARAASLTEKGYSLLQARLGVENLTAPHQLELYHVIHQAIQAHGVYRRDVDYIVEEDRILLIDEFTGRVSEDKRFSDGLHQAIEAKESVSLQAEDQTLAKVTYQTFFGRYTKLAGMTGTAWSEREEFQKTYGREVVQIPTHMPMIRRDYRDAVFNSLAEKHAAVLDEVLAKREDGRPVLIGTTSVRESEQLSARLKEAGVSHEVLNAKNHRAEADVIANAGRKAAVTISTNMAGRGTDILLGGRPEAMTSGRDRVDVVAAGGLHVIGTARHESRRIDDQLRGRAGRQGDPGSSRFVISLDDPVWQRYGAFEIERLRDDLKRAGHQTGVSIRNRAVERVLGAIQNKVEIENAAIRRDVLKYDLVVHVQRETLYAWRQGVLSGESFEPLQVVEELVRELHRRAEDRSTFVGDLCQLLGLAEPHPAPTSDALAWALGEATAGWLSRKERAGEIGYHEVCRRILLDSIDVLWTEHLSALDRLEDGIDLQAYAEVDPVIPWRKLATDMWRELLVLIRRRAVQLWFRVEAA